MELTLHAAQIEDCPRIAELHRAEIRTGFLSGLGIPFLTLLYQSMVTSSRAFCKLARDGDRTIGFISGAESTGGFYKDFLKKNSLEASLILFRKLREPKTVLKICETLFYPTRQNSSNCHAELFSIVLDTKYRNRGIAQRLFAELLHEFEIRGVKHFKVIAGSDLKPACRFYEKVGGKLSSEIEVHKDEKSLVYVWKVG
ncbi:MAG: GNAT family N-acetyltransferase [Desulforhabdus sp.]|jgi:ribosomal protein S18 acetylase RimI-like enzyme|nr:GNAT family N-acetyltransferase [Desulforhabdus sp.]